MQTKPQPVTANELEILAHRFQRIANALTRLACAAERFPILLKIRTLCGCNLTTIERALSRVCSHAARQVMPADEATGRDLLV